MASGSRPVVVVPAIVPPLPGLDIFRGLALLAEGEDGVLQLASAMATALALAAGVILGQYVSQPLRREARRWETRLSGPRMVGPLRRRAEHRDRPAQQGRRRDDPGAGALRGRRTSWSSPAPWARAHPPARR